LVNERISLKGSELLVVSDTHGDVEALTAVFKWAKLRKIGALAFLGDGASDVPMARRRASFLCQVHEVRGNGDMDNRIPYMKEFAFEGHRFLLSHGHLNRVNEGFDQIIQTAESINAEVALFGHTHRIYQGCINGIQLLNPGSLSRPRGSLHKSFATILCIPKEMPKSYIWAIKSAGSGEYTVASQNV